MTMDTHNEHDAIESHGETGANVIMIPLDGKEVAQRQCRKYIHQLTDAGLKLITWAAECRKLGFADIADAATPLLRQIDVAQAQAMKLLETLREAA